MLVVSSSFIFWQYKNLIRGSLHANSLVRSPGQVKMDSEQVKIMKEFV
jgi:hypothetical protein